jgi:hypothetical protein
MADKECPKIEGGMEGGMEGSTEGMEDIECAGG